MASDTASDLHIIYWIQWVDQDLVYHSSFPFIPTGANGKPEALNPPLVLHVLKIKDSIIKHINAHENLPAKVERCFSQKSDGIPAPPMAALGFE